MFFNTFAAISDASLLGYVDGGTGSLLFQIGMGAILSGMYFLTTQWTRLRAWFASKFKKSEAATDS